MWLEKLWNGHISPRWLDRYYGSRFLVYSCHFCLICILRLHNWESISWNGMSPCQDTSKFFVLSLALIEIFAKTYNFSSWFLCSLSCNDRYGFLAGLHSQTVFSFFVQVYKVEEALHCYYYIRCTYECIQKSCVCLVSISISHTYCNVLCSDVPWFCGRMCLILDSDVLRFLIGAPSPLLSNILLVLHSEL